MDVNKLNRQSENTRLDRASGVHPGTALPGSRICPTTGCTRAHCTGYTRARGTGYTWALGTGGSTPGNGFTRVSNMSEHWLYPGPWHRLYPGPWHRLYPGPWYRWRYLPWCLFAKPFRKPRKASALFLAPTRLRRPCSNGAPRTIGYRSMPPPQLVFGSRLPPLDLHPLWLGADRSYTRSAGRCLRSHRYCPDVI
jgi:hypothetical protein